MATLVDDPNITVDDTGRTMAGGVFTTTTARVLVIEPESRTLTVPE